MEGKGTILHRSKDDSTGLVDIQFRFATVAQTVRITDHIHVDLDAAGQLVGVRILAGHEASQGPRLLVCGGRNYGDSRQLWDVLDALEPSVIAHGAARGADRWADLWAQDRGVPCERYPAAWGTHGHLAAGPIRNRAMFDQFKPDAVVAFAGHKGTADMIRVAEKGKVPVVRVATRRPGYIPLDPGRYLV